MISLRCCARAALQVALVGMSLAGTRAAQAGCVQTSQASLVQRSIRTEVSCNDRTLRPQSPPTCLEIAPPACADNLVADAAALGYGSNDREPGDQAPINVNPVALREQLACQKQIGGGIQSYLGVKLRGLVTGRPLEQLEVSARRQLDRISSPTTRTRARSVRTAAPRTTPRACTGSPRKESGSTTRM